MVENCSETERKLSARDHDEIRYLIYCGLTIAETAQKLDVNVNAVGYRVQTYGLNAPVIGVEVVQLELMAALRETNRRLVAPDVNAIDYARLCATQVKQILALARLLPNAEQTEEGTMIRKSEAAKQRFLALSDEDALNELRRVAGLENKSLGCDGHLSEGSGEPSDDESVYSEGDAGSKAATGERD